MFKTKPLKSVLLAIAFKCPKALKVLAVVCLRHLRALNGIARSTFTQSHNLRRIVVVILISFGLAATYLLTATPLTAEAATNNTINFQARLETSAGAIVPDGNYNVTFHLFNASSSTGSTDTSCSTDTNCLWEESYTYNSGSGGSDARVHVANGYLTVNLGSLTAFTSTINWDQQLWLTMDIGGTVSSGTITWDGQMSPRLQLTAVPYAFRAGQLAQYNSPTGYTSTLGLTAPTGGNQSFVLPDMAAAGTYTLMTTSTGVQLQTTTPGTAQTGNFNISGTGIAGTLEANTFDTPTAEALTIGSNNATWINLAQSASFWTGANRTLSVGNASSGAGNSLTIHAGNGASGYTGGNLLLEAGANGTASGTPGSVIVKAAGGDSTSAFQVQNSAGTGVLDVDTTNARIGIGTTAPGYPLSVTSATGTQAAFQSTGSNEAGVFINDAAGGQQAVLSFADAGTTEWQVGKQANNTLFVWDNTNARNVLQTTSGGDLELQPSGGHVGVGTTPAANVELDVSGLSQQTGLSTSGTSGSYAGEWTQLGSCTITAQYSECLTTINIVGGYDGNNVHNTQATVSVRVKQQAAFGSPPIVNITLNNTAEVITKNDIAAVVTQDTPTTIVQLYGRITNSYEQWAYAPTLNTGQGADSWAWTPINGFVASLPAGIVAANQTSSPAYAVYGDSFANTLAVQNSSNVANTFQVLNAAGTSIFNADALDNTVTLLQNAQVNTSSAGACGTNYNLDVTDSLTSPTTSVRWRTNACGANLESGGQDLYLSGWTNANFTGTQFFFLRGNLSTGNLYVGDAAQHAAPELIVLGLGNSSTEPTEYDGAMYYNSSMNSFRCGQNGVWVSCTGLVYSYTSSSGKVNNQPNETAVGPSYTLPYNDCQPGVVYQISMSGYYDTNNSVKAHIYLMENGNNILEGTINSEDTGTHSWNGYMTITCRSTTAVMGAGQWFLSGQSPAIIACNGTCTSSIAWSNDTGGDSLQLAVQWNSALGGSGLGLDVEQFIVQRLGP